MSLSPERNQFVRIMINMFDRLNARERLALFGQVCNAVQHARQQGIIQRDIKPSNVKDIL